MNLASKLEALRRNELVMRLAAFLLCFSLLLGLISPKLEARAFAFAPPAVAAVAAAFLGACGLKVVVDGMDREGLQDAMYKLLKEFLDTELGGITIEEWLGSAWDMTVTLGKIFLGHSLADKLNTFAQWVAGKYATEVGSNIIYEGLDSYPNLISEGVNYPYSEVNPKFCVKFKLSANRARFIQGGSKGNRMPPLQQHNAGGGGCQGRRSRLLYP